MKKIAHIHEQTGQTQSIEEHSKGTAEIAGGFALPELYPLVYNMSMLHDIGKYQDSFQDKIVNNKNIRVDHSSCGAIEVKKIFGNGFASLMAQYCIAGHHSGIPDGGTPQDTAGEPTLYGRLKKSASLEDYSEYRNEIKVNKPDERILQDFLRKSAFDNESLIEAYAFAARYCFSCLTDADSIDTAEFCSGRKEQELKSDFETCLRKINKKFSDFKPETDLQKARSLIQEQVYSKIDSDAEIFLMNMPTGSGKTLCSMKFALERAAKTGKRRIIYVIPYNNIIDQTASVFEELFGGSASILRHQSSYSIDDTDYDEDYKKLVKNVTENWNAQIIITTSVQFFESIYGNKRGKLRKLHNLQNSIIIFDEAHMMPAEYLKPCLRAVSHLTKLLNSEAVFLTATMPDFRSLISKYVHPESRITELIEDRSLFDRFVKGRYVDMGRTDEELLLEKASLYPSSLIVVNKRAEASRLYDLASGRKYHLSTYMASYDRKRVIDEIKKELERLYDDYPTLENVPDERRITVISTSLIEAGVDLDFTTVFRELSGLDSILQAGGRCNREGKRKNAEIFIFELESYSDRAEISVTKSLTGKYDDISSPECIEEYYKKLYLFKNDIIIKNTIADGVSSLYSIPFAGYARSFRIIDDNTVSVAVGLDDNSRKMIEELRVRGFTDHRVLQKYTFTVYEHELQKLIEQGKVKEYGGVWCLVSENCYDRNKGIIFDGHDIII